MGRGPRPYLQKLTAASAALSPPYQTGSAVADILLREKLAAAEQTGVKSEVSLILPAPCEIDDLDLCVIFANALDNAIRACRACGQPGTLWIGGKRQGDFYLLTFANPCDDGPMPPEGTGLSNLRAVAEKYHGALRVEKSAPPPRPTSRTSRTKKPNPRKKRSRSVRKSAAPSTPTGWIARSRR